MWIALVLIAERVDTAAVFAAHRAGPSDGIRSSAVAERIRNGSANVEFLRANMTNDLLPAALRIAPAIESARNAAQKRGIALAMSGSGPSLFALADDRAHAVRMTRSLRRAGLKARVCALGVVP
jgi:4-diphosphocytidyl-2C-methyl-D-erythritol kinase